MILERNGSKVVDLVAGQFLSVTARGLGYVEVLTTLAPGIGAGDGRNKLVVDNSSETIGPFTYQCMVSINSSSSDFCEIISSDGSLGISSIVDASMTWATKKTPDKFGFGSAYFSDIDETLYSNGVSWEIPKFKKKLLNLLPENLKINKLMATPPTINLVTGSDTSDILSPTKYQFNTPTEVVGSNFCSIAHAYNPVILDVITPKNLYSKFNCQTTTNGFEFSKCNIAVNHTGRYLSFHGYTLLDAATVQSRFIIKVNGEHVSFTPTSITPVNTQFVVNLDFGSIDTRRVEFFSYFVAQGGISTEATDTLTPAALNGPRVAIIADSIGGGAYGDRLVHDYCTSFGDSLGWDIVESRSVGGTRIKTGTNNYISRIAKDISPHEYDIIFVQLSTNEVSITDISSSLRELLILLRDDKPKALLGVIAPMLRGGPGRVTTPWWNAIYACKAVIEDEFDGIFLNHYEQPLATGSPAKTQTLRASAATAATTLATTTAPSIGSCFKFPDNTHFRVKSVSGVEPTITVTLDSVLQIGQANGAVATEVGQSFHTGTGYDTAPTGWGNGDVFMTSDFTHYTDLGHYAMGRCLANLFKYEMNRRFGE